MANRDTAVQSALLRLRHLIAMRFEVGDQLPTEKTLAESMDVSRGTVREALGILATEGIVNRRWGAGTFVNPPRPVASLNMSAIQSFRDRVQSSGRIVTLLDGTCERVECPPDASRALQLSNGATAWLVRRLFAVDGTPAALMHEHIPLELFGRPIDPAPMRSLETDLFEMLNRHQRGATAHTVTDIEAVALDAADAEPLGLDPGCPVIRAVQVTYSPDNEPLAYGRSLQRTDLVRMRITR
ncbi:GntR family transcriptional regulator [Cellulomonas fimi]|uniref:GntR family transcriptional regulator n=1 Tax=Cellulomonas fimi TaxID=1708 RepID=A0A7Y0LYT9_CELFI|nr:GntR family transcriptional regulator [Cellulomonas fimi]NMR19237.1 GntR family transcriptional regulator [Cellulomonas fimi]